MPLSRHSRAMGTPSPSSFQAMGGIHRRQFPPGVARESRVAAKPPCSCRPTPTLVIPGDGGYPSPTVPPRRSPGIQSGGEAAMQLPPHPPPSSFQAMGGIHRRQFPPGVARESRRGEAAMQLPPHPPPSSFQAMGGIHRRQFPPGVARESRRDEAAMQLPPHPPTLVILGRSPGMTTKGMNPYR